MGAFAAVAGVSAKVLRDYDARGVFRPVWVDPSSGYRMYSPAQLPQLRRILALRDLGVGVETIRELVEDCRDLATVLRQRRGELERQQRELERKLAVLGVQLEAADATDAADIVVRVVPAVRVATTPIAETGGDVGQAFYRLERRVQRLGARAPLPPGLVESRRGPGPFVYVPVRRALGPAVSTQTLPAVRAATVVHQGSYAGLDRTRRKLRSWLRNAGIRQHGPMRIGYLRFGAEPELRIQKAYLTDRSHDLLTELHCPIEVL